MFVEHPKHREQIQALQQIAIAEVAATMHCTPQHIRNLIARGDFPQGKKIGHLRRWSVSEIETYLRKKESK
ncbi:MAG: helix-turn-helix domain-containing protein [Rubripirellula sp.]|nr:helix-turn-helix domain-containing protein [Rubripirellula sp.]